MVGPASLHLNAVGLASERQSTDLMTEPFSTRDAKQISNLIRRFGELDLDGILTNGSAEPAPSQPRAA